MSDHKAVSMTDCHNATQLCCEVLIKSTDPECAKRCSQMKYSTSRIVAINKIIKVTTVCLVMTPLATPLQIGWTSLRLGALSAIDLTRLIAPNPTLS